MESNSDHAAPLVTIVLYAFNEQTYVRAAVQSMLDQDYENLEIVLSDDGSTDGTYEIMESMAASYKGPHRILLNRNSRNIGIGSQINAAVAMSLGELVVLANADDVSRSDRVRQVVRAWLGGRPRPTAVWSSLRQIDEQGRPLGRVMSRRVRATNLAIGVRDRFDGPGAASLSVDRRVFTEFGPLFEDLILEDCPLLGRAMLLGTICYLEEPLVDYRVHSENISQSYAVSQFDTWVRTNRNRLVWQKREGVKAYLQITRDLHQGAAERWEHNDLAVARWFGMEKVMENSILLAYYAGDSAIDDGVRFGSLFRLALLILKARIKRLLPLIERRNERWHYQSAVNAARDKS